MTGIVTLGALNTALVLVVDSADATGPRLTRLGWHPPAWLMITAAVAAPLLLLGRRRAPVLVTALTAVTYLASSVLLPVGFALLTVAVQRRDLVLLAVTTGVAVVFWLSFGVPDPWYLSAALAVVLASFWALWGSYVGARRALLQSLRDRARRAEEEQAARADQARQTERARIAREMHDVVAHKVSLIALQAGGLEVNAQLAPDRVAGTAAQIRMTAREALEDLRSVLGVLRAGEAGTPGGGAELAPQPGLDDVPTLVDRSRAAGVPVTLVWAPNEPDADAATDPESAPHAESATDAAIALNTRAATHADVTTDGSLPARAGDAAGPAPAAANRGAGGSDPAGAAGVPGALPGSAGGTEQAVTDLWRTPRRATTPVDPATGRTAYRVVQEALTNVTKHARGAATVVTVRRQAPDPTAGTPVGTGPVLVVSVVNRCPVASGALLPGSGAGLIGLRERVELVGGRLSTGPTGEGGWAVRAVLPVHGEDAGPAAARPATGGSWSS